VKKVVSISLLTAIYLSMAAWAHAGTLVGSQVTLTSDFPTLGTAFTVPITATAGAGIEFPSGSIVPLAGFFVVPVNIDVGMTSIDFQYTGSGTAFTVPFDGYVFDFASGPTITGVSLDPLSTFTSSQVVLGFGPNQVTVNVEGLSVSPSSRILVDVSLPASAVPEPQSYALILAGLGIIVMCAKPRVCHKGRFNEARKNAVIFHSPELRCATGGLHRPLGNTPLSRD
jgi:hypothetical protein